jgi:hypothetical protein
LLFPCIGPVIIDVRYLIEYGSSDCLYALKRFQPAFSIEEQMTSQVEGSFLTPRDITKTGKLASDIWLIGTVVRVRQFKKDAAEGEPGKGKGKKDGKRKGGGKQKKSTDRSNECVEIYVNGGKTPADVMVLSAWDDKARTKLLPLANKNAQIMVSKIFVKEHTEKTSQWTTSRHALCGVIDSSSEVRLYEGAGAWLKYHPITPLPSLQFLPHNSFVCIAGMVLSPGPVVTPQNIDGQDVNVTNFHIRAKDGIVKVEAWRDVSEYASEVVAGQIYFFECMKKISPDRQDLSISVVRYQKSTSHYNCDADLEKEITLATADNHTGATTISPTAPVNTRISAESYKVWNADWVSLSVIADIVAGDVVRSLDGAVQVPSVLLKPVGEKITYLGCADCGKGVYETKSCQCATTETKIRFRTQLRLADDTYQLNAVVFDAMDSLVKLYADGDADKEKPSYYHEEPVHVEELSMAVEAMPCTVLLAFETNSYTTKIEVSVKAVERTFSAKQEEIRHPLKPILRCGQTTGRSFICPACAVADTSFEEGAGVTLVPGGTAQKFRALLTVLDKQATTERAEDATRADDASAAVRCSRKVSCALKDEADTTTYIINSVGPINFATRLLTPRKGELLHAIVSWRSKTQLALLAFVSAADTEEDAAAFRDFFATEVQLIKASLEEPTKSVVEFEAGTTPSKKHKEAMDAARQLATPEPWAKRNRTE